MSIVENLDELPADTIFSLGKILINFRLFAIAEKKIGDSGRIAADCRVKPQKGNQFSYV